jgi:hypothetical protein
MTAAVTASLSSARPAAVRPTRPLPRMAVCAAMARASAGGQLGNSSKMVSAMRAVSSRGREFGVAVGRHRETRNTVATEDAASRIAKGDVAWGPSSIPFLAFLALLPGQHQELRVGRQYLAHGILELTPRLHPAPHVLHPFFGNVLDMLFPPDHKGQGPDGMALALGAMTGGLATAQMTEGERAGEEILRDMETAQQLELALNSILPE